MAEETHYTASTGLKGVATLNTNLNGTGVIDTLFTAGSKNGALIKSITIKAAATTTEGMIRLYIDPNLSGTKYIFTEIEVPAITPSATDPSFEKHLELNLNLKAGGELYGSTEKGETFYIITEAFNWSYYASAVRIDATKYTAKTGMVRIITANSNLNGTTGTYGTVLTAGVSGSGWNGCKIKSITVKAMQTTTKGMVRLFVQDTSSASTKLLTEIPVSATTSSAKEKSFEHTIYFEDSFSIAPGYKILASTEKGESFFVTADAADWTYVA